jgi:general secretion pathway protein D
MIDPGEPIASIPLALSYDAKALEVVSVTEGGVLKQGGATTNFSHRIDRGSGQIFATTTRSGKDGASAPGTVLELSLRAVAPSSGARVSVGAVAPVGLGGRAVNVAQPAPLLLTIAQ